jgi:hypothetical protein
MTVTRQVISDLWPLYVSGEASAETRALVEAFLTSDPSFAATLRQSVGGPPGLALPPTLTPDHELETLARVRRRLRGYSLWLLLAMIFTMLSFGRIVSDTSWDVSPRNFLILASMAMTCWIAFFVTLLRMRARILVVPERRAPRRS